MGAGAAPGKAPGRERCAAGTRRAGGAGAPRAVLSRNACATRRAATDRTCVATLSSLSCLENRQNLKNSLVQVNLRASKLASSKVCVVAQSKSSCSRVSDGSLKGWMTSKYLGTAASHAAMPAPAAPAGAPGNPCGRASPRPMAARSVRDESQRGRQNADNHGPAQQPSRLLNTDSRPIRIQPAPATLPDKRVHSNPPKTHPPTRDPTLRNPWPHCS